jgi:nitrite reductase/ring-hydroxylating ferredoxin subunit
MTRYPVCHVDELPDGGSRIIEVGARSIGVFRVGDEYFAVRNRCPHKGAPLCLGYRRGLVTSSQPGEYVVERPGQILCCPWHGWEFDLTTGASVFNPHRLRVKKYDVSFETPACDDDPSLETYDVSLGAGDQRDRRMIYVHVS